MGERKVGAAAKVAIPAIDREHAQAEVERVTEAIKMETSLLKMALDAEARTAVSTHSGRLNDLKMELNRRKAELRQFSAGSEVVSPEEVTAEICAALEDDWPIGLVERIYQSCRARLKIDDHLPEAPKHLWH